MTGDGVAVGQARGQWSQPPWVVPDELQPRIEPLLPIVPRRADHPGRKRLDDWKVLSDPVRARHQAGRLPLDRGTLPGLAALVPPTAPKLVPHQPNCSSTIRLDCQRVSLE
jgi:hypothetical protein